LLLRSVGCDAVDVDSIVHELMEELLGTVLRLDEDQDGWPNALSKSRERDSERERERDCEREIVRERERERERERRVSSDTNLLEQLSHSEQLALLLPTKDQPLLDGLGRGISITIHSQREDGRVGVRP